MTTNQECPFCKTPSVTRNPDGDGALYGCNHCGSFFLGIMEEDHLEYMTKNDPERLKRAAALLFERNAKGLTSPFVVDFEGGKEPPNRHFVVIRFDDLLAQWPATVAELLDRCLLNICHLSEKPGRRVDFHDINNPYLFFSKSPGQYVFCKNALQDYKWINVDLVDRRNIFRIQVTAKGWARFDELTRYHGKLSNPVFVAMWFGGKTSSDQQRMTDRFEQTIKAPCMKLGWLAERVDSEEHNESIMDRIVALIREAPFMIADLTKNNQGVYYEAGFAKGLGKEVIYLVNESEPEPVHFDLSGVNHVRWTEEAELRTKLENRILGTMGRGPHRFDKSI